MEGNQQERESVTYIFSFIKSALENTVFVILKAKQTHKVKLISFIYAYERLLNSNEKSIEDNQIKFKHLAEVSNSGESKRETEMLAYPKHTREPGSRSKPSMNCVN